MAQPTKLVPGLRLPGFVPPAVQDAEVQPAVGEGLHAAGAAGFQRAAAECSARRRSPAPGSGPRPCRSLRGRRSRRRNSGRWASLTICWMSALPASSRGCALPAKRICTGRCASLRMRAQPVQVAQQQSGPLVGGETAREADGEGVGIEHFVGARRFPPGGRRGAAVGRAGAGGRRPPGARGGARGCATTLRPGWSPRALPKLGVGVLFAPLRAQVAVVELVHFVRNPGAEVNAVGDRADGDFVLRHAGPEGLPHLAASPRRAAC